MTEFGKTFPGKGPEIKAIASTIDSLLGSFGLKKQCHGWQVVTQWESIVGKQIADVAVAERFDDSILFVRVQDSVWRQELSMQVEQILKQIHARPYGRAVKNIRFV